MEIDGDLDVEIITIKTKGDKITDVPLARAGAQGIFVKEIEDTLLEGKIDIAVHSAKDLPSDLPAGLSVPAFTKREDPRDVIIIKRAETFETLPVGARVGTSSIRRRAQLLAIRADIEVLNIRGNLDTRIKKLYETDLDAIIVAAAGLARLGIVPEHAEFLPPKLMTPAVGQGALAIECREDSTLLETIKALNDRDTADAVRAERAFLKHMGGGCQIPIAAHAICSEKMIEITAMIATPDGKKMIRDHTTGARNSPEEVGRELAHKFAKKGAGKILEALPSSLLLPDR